MANCQELTQVDILSPTRVLDKGTLPRTIGLDFKAVSNQQDGENAPQHPLPGRLRPDERGGASARQGAPAHDLGAASTVGIATRDRDHLRLAGGARPPANTRTRTGGGRVTTAV